MVLWSLGGKYGSALQLKVFVLELSHGDKLFSAEMESKAVMQAVWEVD
jgi:hypothetical protein